MTLSHLELAGAAVVALMLVPTTTSFIDGVLDWAREGYAAAPALLLALAALIALTVLAVLAGWFGGRSETAVRTRLVRLEKSPPVTDRKARRDSRRNTAWPGQAWIEVDGKASGTIREMVRIGREDDNDIVLPDQTVHRYHAVIHRTDEAIYRITDLSSVGGNGILLNGQRVADAQLQDGDQVQLGTAKVTFRETSV